MVPVPPVGPPVEAHRALVVSELQEAGTLFFPVQRKEANKSWIQESTWQVMSLVQAWRKVRSEERAWWNKLQLCILWQGWRSWLLVYVDRAALFPGNILSGYSHEPGDGHDRASHQRRVR